VRGALNDPYVFRLAAMVADGVFTLAFINDFCCPEAVAAGIAEETAAITVIGEALIGSAKPLVVCSGTPWIPGRHSTEADALPTEGPLGGRARTVNRTLALSTQGVRASAVRLPRTVHQNGDGGFAGILTHVARETGVSGYPGDGTQRWPAVHSADAATLFRLALEKAPAGTSWHAVADDGDQVHDIAAVIGRRLGVPTRQVPAETYGPLGEFFVIDQPSSSATTREALGWNPTHPSLLEDLELVQP
jgi:nucleoside-diphosphate-sugar epimerase